MNTCYPTDLTINPRYRAMPDEKKPATEQPVTITEIEYQAPEKASPEQEKTEDFEIIVMHIRRLSTVWHHRYKFIKQKLSEDPGHNSSLMLSIEAMTLQECSRELMETINKS